MSTVKPTYEELEQRLREVEGLLDAMRTGKVDSVVSDRDTSHLLVLRDHELELQKERQLAELRAIIETVPTALAIVWPDGEIRLANRAFLGAARPSDCTSLRAWAAGVQAHVRFAEELEEHLRESFHGLRQSIPMEARFRTRAGNEFYWFMTFQQLPGEIEGKPAVIVTGTDVTDEKRLIDQLSDAKAQMEDFLSAAAHDLKTPLITIAHNVTFARIGQGDTLAAETAECLDRIQSAVQDMKALLRQISEVYRVGHDMEPRKLHSFHELAQLALCQLEGTLAERGAKVTIDNGLPKLYCQGNKIVQIFFNLISNAIKYTPSERTPQIEVGYQGHDGLEYLLFVRDTGNGIPEEGLKEIFTPFRRLSTDPKASGEGLGLNIVKRAVELHGGRIWAESVLGEGSIFYFTIQQRKNDHDDNN